MKRICIVPVCYNAHKDAFQFLESIERAFDACSRLQLDVVLADNSTALPQCDMLSRRWSYSFYYLKNDNVGYFPAFNGALANLPLAVEEYDFVIVCNVDLIVAGDFFSSLLAHPLTTEAGLVAPGIFSDQDGRNLNPKIKRRPSVHKINFMSLICSNVVLFRWYRQLAVVRQRVRAWIQKRKREVTPAATPVKQPDMYGAHGSFMIFTRRYFTQSAHVAYPRFLFGEEVFVAEQLRMHRLKIDNAPNVRVFDKEHVSTSQLKLKFLCGEHKKSYEYLKKHFFYNEI